MSRSNLAAYPRFPALRSFGAIGTFSPTTDAGEETAMTMQLKAVLIPAALAAAMVASQGQASAPNSLLHRIANDTTADLKAMEGKRVLGKSRELLGHVGMVDAQAKMAQLKVPTGAVVSIPTDLLVEEGDHLVAPSLSRGDVIAMISRPGEATVHEAGIGPASKTP